MKQIITGSDKNLEILNKLILNGFYTGFIGSEKFELLPNRFPNNYRLIGIKNKNGNYDLKFDFKSPVNIAAKFLLVLGILMSVISLIKGNYILLVAVGISGLFIFIPFKLNEKKEISYLTDKILQYHRSEYEDRF